ncbi:hypothetical protein M436DRAFT_38329 [Aureobasidium namibiae CBS 147.97]|uniref:Myb-like domain-containing protein n=1 Tax=Aureobasidium namibiae CBS 147.97 TaxID=1043004 RepID=A0A074X3Q2_9PEZI|nr:uncharacterized protein M436DRAFT_38329 [Aureobasidium namibiae CBS 147.97]KEQ76622.1 hypothetical protein M436DRAFT_38329 [Aureobasidium namibiae CBS 147.97]
MSSLFDQDAKGYFFDMECPELTGSESSESPTNSCFTNGCSVSPPSPCQDAKDLTLSGHGVTTYSPVSDPSPLSNFGENCFDVAPSWSEQPAVLSGHTATQYASGIWSRSQYTSAQSLFDTTGRVPAMPVQPRSDVVFEPSAFQDMFPMALPDLPTTIAPQLEQNMPAGFVGYGADGLVVPGHLFNTALDKFAFAEPSPVLLSTQVITDDGLALAALSCTNDFKMPSEPAEQASRYVPEISRNTRDEYLQESRRRGLSYKEIKRRGGFTEAESTLRGRIRILSKPKEMRVRKPQWNRSDILLLVNAVEHFSESAQGPSSRKTNLRQRSNGGKLPWKKVAEWMFSHGASYPFAGATCAKKWEQMREEPFGPDEQ